MTAPKHEAEINAYYDEAREMAEENSTESETTDAEQVAADGVSPDAASEAEEMES